MKTHSSIVESKKKQGGLVVVLFTLCLLILLGFAALAIDINHMILNKSRLQNSVDSAALASSVAIENGSSSRDSIDQSLATLGETANASGNSELLFGGNYNQLTQVSNTKYVAEYDDYEVYYYFSNNPTEFGDSVPFQESRDIYTRVVVSDHSLESYLIHIFGLAKNVSASAVSGRSSGFKGISNIAPIGICDQLEDDPDSNGYIGGKKYALAGKCSGNNDKQCSTPDTGGDIGAGNYNYLRLDGYGNGADGVGDAIGGKAPGEFDDGESGIYLIEGEIVTKPGINNGPVTGFNSRFEQVDGFPPPDPAPLNSESITTFQDYVEAGGSKLGRRTMTVPVVECDANGNKPVTILGFECFFLYQKYDKKEKIIWGEFIEGGCPVANGVGGNDPIASGPYRIQLYKDPYSGES
ncbi:Tad domain-containing protein [Vibrio breoganii]|uniref:Tad domain-containing protein n=1 Tax=Vibrio breoganii TaxID=553239 RepID=UPI0021C4965C|nr:Tad domain-containing protein [Vibrio breoganii]MDN3717470.1 Tad domain-containing protein [Vibrio breoganii]